MPIISFQSLESFGALGDQTEGPSLRLIVVQPRIPVKKPVKINDAPLTKRV